MLSNINNFIYSEAAICKKYWPDSDCAKPLVLSWRSDHFRQYSMRTQRDSLITAVLFYVCDVCLTFLSPNHKSRSRRAENSACQVANLIEEVRDWVISGYPNTKRLFCHLKFERSFQSTHVWGDMRMGTYSVRIWYIRWGPDAITTSTIKRNRIGVDICNKTRSVAINYLTIKEHINQFNITVLTSTGLILSNICLWWSVLNRVIKKTNYYYDRMKY